MAGRFEFKFKPQYYTTDGAKTLQRKDIKALRAEYTRMRDVAQKRVARLQKEYDWTQSAKQSYMIKTPEGTIIKQGFPKLAEINPEDLPKAFQELASFVKFGGSTITGQKSMQEKTMATLNKNIEGTKGAEISEDEEEPQDDKEGAVNKGNYSRVISILNETRRLKISKLYGSDTVVELANATLSLTKRQFNKMLDDLQLYLDHAHEVQAEIEVYRSEHNNHMYMNDFKKKTGWV